MFKIFLMDEKSITKQIQNTNSNIKFKNISRCFLVSIVNKTNSKFENIFRCLLVNAERCLSPYWRSWPKPALAQHRHGAGDLHGDGDHLQDDDDDVVIINLKDEGDDASTGATQTWSK